MKKLPPFLSGVLLTLFIASLTIGTLAVTGKLTIDVYPINVQVNGETFKPKDANGKEVDIFNYNGTTYAPLRALAEAYGLEVGYDAEKNMATVSDPSITPDTSILSSDYSDWSEEDEIAYQEFKEMFDIENPKWQDPTPYYTFAIIFKGTKSEHENFVKIFGEQMYVASAKRILNEKIYDIQSTTEEKIEMGIIILPDKSSCRLTEWYGRILYYWDIKGESHYRLQGFEN